jgi:protein ImuB
MNGAFLPPPPIAKALTPQEEAARYADCSCPRGGGWRPGARWAENSKERTQLAALKERTERRSVEAQIAQLPPHQRPQMRELGRRTEPAPVAFRHSSPAGGRGRGAAGAEADGGGARAQLASSSAAGKNGGSAAAPPPPFGRSPSPANAGEDLPIVITHRVGQRVVIAAACPAAAALGLTPGMPLTQARVLAPGLEVREAEPARDAALLERIALLAARRWTPRAAVSGTDGLWLDFTGVAHLFGGEAALCRRILAACARIGLAARIAVAGSLGAAHALARCRTEAITLCPSGAEAEALAPLPIGALRLEPDLAGAAARLGLETIGDLIAVPRAPLQRRFGRPAEAARPGARPRRRAFDPVVPESRRHHLRFAEPIGTAEAIAQALADGDDATDPRAAACRLGVRPAAARLHPRSTMPQSAAPAIGHRPRHPRRRHFAAPAPPQIETSTPGFGIERIA